MLGELPCAAKHLHPTIVDPTRPRNRVLFQRECRFLSQSHHPNIVQYLGVAQDPSTGLPILLMELMDDSLTHFLQQSEIRLPYHVQVNINYDIAQALACSPDPASRPLQQQCVTGRRWCKGKSDGFRDEQIDDTPFFHDPSHCVPRNPCLHVPRGHAGQGGRKQGGTGCWCPPTF